MATRKTFLARAQARKRNANFTELETNVLLALTKKPKFSTVIRNKKTNAPMNMMKRRIWREIESEFNSTPGCQKRSALCLRQKLDNIRKDERKEIKEREESVSMDDDDDDDNDNDNNTLLVVTPVMNAMEEEDNKDSEEIITLSCEDFLKPFGESEEIFSYDLKPEKDENVILMSNRIELLTSKKVELLELKRSMVMQTQKQTQEEHELKMKILKLQEEKYAQKIRLLKLEENEILLKMAAQ